MSDTHFGFIAMIGAPNVGKSTLTNALVGQKIAIVTHKAQTTRARLRGVFTHHKAQIVLVDTPGIFAGQKKLDHAMVQEAWAACEAADAIAMIVDAKQPHGAAHELILPVLKKSNKPLCLILNKTDAVDVKTLPALAQHFSDVLACDNVFMVSALKKDGLDDVRRFFADIVPKGVWHYPEDVAADMPSVLLAAEITREKLFLRMHQELPYALTVETEDWQQQDDGSVKINQIIYVRRPSQKAMILGKRGQAIKEIGKAARLEMEALFGHRVHLFLFVKVRDNWIDDAERYRMMGIG